MTSLLLDKRIFYCLRVRRRRRRASIITPTTIARNARPPTTLPTTMPIIVVSLSGAGDVGGVGDDDWI
jgi:hypothetical protein